MVVQKPTQGLSVSCVIRCLLFNVYVLACFLMFAPLSVHIIYVHKQCAFSMAQESEVM